MLVFQVLLDLGGALALPVGRHQLGLHTCWLTLAVSCCPVHISIKHGSRKQAAHQHKMLCVAIVQELDAWLSQLPAAMQTDWATVP